MYLHQEEVSLSTIQKWNQKYVPKLLAAFRTQDQEDGNCLIEDWPHPNERRKALNDIESKRFNIQENILASPASNVDSLEMWIRRHERNKINKSQAVVFAKNLETLKNINSPNLSATQRVREIRLSLENRVDRSTCSENISLSQFSSSTKVTRATRSKFSGRNHSF